MPIKSVIVVVTAIMLGALSPAFAKDRASAKADQSSSSYHEANGPVQTNLYQGW